MSAKNPPPIEVGQHRSDPGKKGRIVKIIAKCQERHRENCWLIKSIGSGGRTSAVSGFRLISWPLVEAP
jgi:hypothetical protein